MRILIATGIYPPDIGGPAQYARNLCETWKNVVDRNGKPIHQVKVAAYRWERAFPPIVRHFLYFLKIIRKGWNADMILVLDTWSAAVPTMFACALMGKKYAIRTGGDFLWESYVERTGDLILFRHFYDRSKRKYAFSGKEKLTFKLSGQVLRKAKAVIFSTKWQKEIFEKAYRLDSGKDSIVENFYGEKLEPTNPDNRSFIASTRVLKWKNVELLKAAFGEAQTAVEESGLARIDLDTNKAAYDNFIERIRHSYAVILVSLGDISPNMIMDAIRAGTPFVVTRETGIADRIKDCAVFVDPLDKNDIAAKIVWLADSNNRAAQAERVRQFKFIHSWTEIADEITKIWQNF